MKWIKKNNEIAKEIAKELDMPYKKVKIILKYFFRGLASYMDGKNWISLRGYFKIRMKYYWYKKFMAKEKEGCEGVKKKPS
jgi:nucleoid DNA-binding protein